MRRIVVAGALAAFVFQPVAAMASGQDFALQGYALPADKEVTIALMRPDVTVGELQAGGLPQPNADWTSAAREQVAKALKAELETRKIKFVVMEDQGPAYLARHLASEKARCDALAAQAAASAPVAPAAASAAADASAAPPATALAAASAVPACDPAAVPAPIDPDKLVADYNGLHEAVVQAILAHKYGLGAGKLPTKKEAFDYTLGPGAAQLSEVSGANYGIFVMTLDEFASSGRKAMQVMGALGCLVGACVIVGGGIHVSYVSLVDLQTGKIVWFNLQRGSKGDVREEVGAQDMVHAVLASMPSRPGEMAVAQTPAK